MTDIAELSNIEPGEWLNIPVPLVGAMTIISSKLLKAFNIMSFQGTSFHKVTTKLGVKLEKIDIEFRNLAERLEAMVK